ncbi:MAG: hypothetical protein R3F21_16930 [Myxococcota bacterium]
MLFIGFVPAFAGCGKPPLGFQVPPDEIRDGFDVVAIAPMRLPPTEDGHLEVRAQLESLLRDRLIAAGLEVVGSDEFEPLWRSLSADVGGIHDPKTGVGDESKFEIVFDAAYRELRATRGVDAIAQLSIGFDPDFAVSDRAVACGGWSRIYWPGGWHGARATMVTVACLDLSLFDEFRRQLYGVRTPIEVVETHGHQTRARRRKGEAFADPEGLERALDRVVSSFVDVVGDGD